jgi:hypothetical protein
MEEEDAFFDKALEGFALFAFNQGEVCTCPSRALVQESIYERFMERAIRRVESIRSGNPLDNVTQMGAQVSHGQLETILNYIDIGKKEGADILTGGRRKVLGGDLQDGITLSRRSCLAEQHARLPGGDFRTGAGGDHLQNDGGGAGDCQRHAVWPGGGVWSRNGNLAYKMGRGIQAGRVWTNCYHAYPAHAAFGGYKQSGIGRETHKMMLEHYQQTKCLLVSYSDKPLGLFYRPAQAVPGRPEQFAGAGSSVRHPGRIARARAGIRVCGIWRQIEPPLFLMREAGNQHPCVNSFSGSLLAQKQSQDYFLPAPGPSAYCRKYNYRSPGNHARSSLPCTRKRQMFASSTSMESMRIQE